VVCSVYTFVWLEAQCSNRFARTFTVLLLCSTVPLSDKVSLVTEGGMRFVKKCNEFCEPIEDAITEDEIHAVLSAAQKHFRFLDIIAPRNPLMILRFDNSHTINNSECGVSSNPVSAATILLFHPRTITPNNRVFIFAHELGHAFHLALAKNIEIVPEGFDKINEALGVEAKRPTKNKKPLQMRWL
jgi:hypothetical protein